MGGGQGERKRRKKERKELCRRREVNYEAEMKRAINRSTKRTHQRRDEGL